MCHPTIIVGSVSGRVISWVIFMLNDPLIFSLNDHPRSLIVQDHPHGQPFFLVNLGVGLIGKKFTWRVDTVLEMKTTNYLEKIRNFLIAVDKSFKWRQDWGWGLGKCSIHVRSLNLNVTAMSISKTPNRVKWTEMAAFILTPFVLFNPKCSEWVQLTKPLTCYLLTSTTECWHEVLHKMALGHLHTMYHLIFPRHNFRFVRFTERIIHLVQFLYFGLRILCCN